MFEYKTLRISLPVFLLTMASLCAFTSEPTAETIVRKSEDKMRGKTLQGQMQIQTIRPAYTRTMDVKAWMKGNDYSMIQVLSPAKEKGVTFLKRQKEVWNWIPTLERTIKLPPSMMSQSWMGTDFTNDDLVKESSIIEDYDQSIAGTETIQKRTCWKIILIPKPSAAVVWGKVIIWIDQQDYLQLRSEFYDEDGELTHTMIGTDIREIGGRIIPTTLEMTPAAKPGNKTVIRYISLQFDAPIPDEFFSTQNMRSIK